MENEIRYIQSSRSSIKQDYYKWLLSMVGADDRPEYSVLIDLLHRTEFEWVIPNDSNRADEGIDLRYRYLDENELSYSGSWGEPCSMLEMLVALSCRIAEDIMPDADEGIDYWFWCFINNLGLMELQNDSFEQSEYDEIVDKFINRKGKFGYGMLFFSRKLSARKLNSMEIWYQMHVWLEENFDF